LSPVAEDLIAQAESKGTIATSSNDKKRKAETTEVKLTKRTKKTTTLKTEDEDFVVGADASPRPNKRAPRKVKVEVETIGDDVVLEENGKGKAKVIRKTTTRKKVEVEAAPFAERTTDSPLVLGAHVSTAGG
jgi:AP endonuclease-1